MMTWWFVFQSGKRSVTVREGGMSEEGEADDDEMVVCISA